MDTTQGARNAGGHGANGARADAGAEVRPDGRGHTDEAFSTGSAQDERAERAAMATKLGLAAFLKGRLQSFADAAGCSATLIRTKLSIHDTRRLPIDALVAAAEEDYELAREVWHEVGRLMERAARPGTVSVGDVAHELRRVGVRVGALTGILDDALADGAIDNRERAAAKNAIRTMREQLDKLDRAVDRGGA